MEPTTPRPRLTSLDVFRGLVVALLVLVEWVLPAPGYTWLRHSPWDGVRIPDVVFPAFLFMVGASASLATRVDLRRLARRSLVLVGLGLLFNAWGGAGSDLTELRLPGVLQMIGVAGLLAGFVTAVVRRPAAVAGIGLALVTVHGALLSHVPVDCGTGRLVPGCSLPWAVDRHVFGLAHVYHQGTFGHDPEGLVTTVLGATAVVLFGWAAGRFLYREADRMATAMLAGGLLVAAGFAALGWPLLKRLWTPTFGLLMAAGCTAVLLALAMALDGRAHRFPQPVRWTLTALGRNALLVYVGQHVVLSSLQATAHGDGTLATALLDPFGSPLGVGVAAVVGWTTVAAALHALDWHWTV
jgi:predicted acyltransferase